MSAHPDIIQQEPPKESRVSSEYLHDLLFLSQQDFQMKISEYAERHNRSLINEQDENGQTLAHHIAANPAGIIGCNLEIIGTVLKNNPDFSLQDNLGNTPMHSITNICHCDKDAAGMFYAFAEYAAQHQFDFSNLKNNKGRGVLHIAAFTRYGRAQTVASILNLAEKYKCKIDLDALSGNTGTTALFYLLNHCRYEEAKMLIKAGADVTKQGDFAADCPDKDGEPISRQPYHYTLELLSRLRCEGDVRLNPMIESLEEIKIMMESKLSNEVKETAAFDNFIKTLQRPIDEFNCIEETTESHSIAALLSTSLPHSWQASGGATAEKDPSDDNDNTTGSSLCSFSNS